MKIIRYHMLIVNTYNALEAEVKLENGDIVYPHIDGPKENGIKLIRIILTMVLKWYTTDL